MKSKKKEIAIFGGAFSPPTIAHASIITKTAKCFDEVWIIPSIKHAFNKQMLDDQIRVQLLSALLTDIDMQNVKIMNCEKAVSMTETVYTIDLLDYLSSTYTDTDFVFVCGDDNIKNFNNFKDHKGILERHQIISFNESDLPDARSTYVRNSIRDENEEWKEMVTLNVQVTLAKFIDKYGVFKSGTDIDSINAMFNLDNATPRLL